MRVNGNELLCVGCSCFYEGRFWFSHATSNRIYYSDGECNGLARLFCTIDEEDDDIFLFGGLIPYGHWLYVFPKSAKFLYKINIINGAKVKINVWDDRFLSSDNKYFSGHIYKDKLFLFGSSYAVITVVDCISDTSIFIKSELEFAMKELMHPFPVFIKYTKKEYNKIFFPLCRKNYYGVIDCDSYCVEYKRIGHKPIGYCAIEKKDDDIWLISSKEGMVIKQNEKTSECFFYNEEADGNMRDFCASIMLGDNVVFLPYQKKGFWNLDRTGIKCFYKDVNAKNTSYYTKFENGVFVSCFDRSYIIYKKRNIKKIYIFTHNDTSVFDEGQKIIRENMDDNLEIYIASLLREER